MFLKKYLSALLLIGSVSLSVHAIAGDLTIANNTNHDSTCIINNGACSNIMGAVGVTHAHTTNVVPEKLVTKACMFNKINCTAAVHMTNNCTGPTVAIVVLDVVKGIKEVQLIDSSQGYIIAGRDFLATLDGGPAFNRWLHFFRSNSM